MTQREIREQLGRVKPYYLRNEMLRALAAAISAIRGLGAAPVPSELRSVIREAMQLLARDASIKAQLKEPLTYTPGQERALLMQLALAYKGLKEAEDFEDHEVALERKVKLDQAYNQGMRLLEQGKHSEADASFTEALTYYRDEHRVFYLIGKALMEAEEVRRAYPYIKRGMEVDSGDKEMFKLFEECAQLRETAQK